MSKDPTKDPAAAPGDGDSGHSGNDYLTIHQFLEKTTTALTNAQLPDALSLMTARGYAATDITDKIAETEALRILNEKQRTEYGEQYEATKAYNDARARIHEDYIDHLRLARVIFKRDTAAKTGLGLRGNRSDTQAGYAGQGLQFYNNALGKDAYIKALAKIGISKDDLKAGLEGFRNLQTLTAAQQKETGEAQKATETRDAAYDALADWMSDFYEVAKVALRKQPTVLRQLGI